MVRFTVKMGRDCSAPRVFGNCFNAGTTTRGTHALVRVRVPDAPSGNILNDAVGFSNPRDPPVSGFAVVLRRTGRPGHDHERGVRATAKSRQQFLQMLSESCAEGLYPSLLFRVAE